MVVEEKKPPKEEVKSDCYVPPSRRAQGFNTTSSKKPTTSSTYRIIIRNQGMKMNTLITFVYLQINLVIYRLKSYFLRSVPPSLSKNFVCKISSNEIIIFFTRHFSPVIRSKAKTKASQ